MKAARVPARNRPEIRGSYTPRRSRDQPFSSSRVALRRRPASPPQRRFRGTTRLPHLTDGSRDWTGGRVSSTMTPPAGAAGAPEKTYVTTNPDSGAIAPPAAPRSWSPPALLRRLYDWTLHWAETRWGPVALGLLAFTESSFFPIPPDPLLMALALGQPRKSWRFASLCTAGSVVGGVAGYFIGLYLWGTVDQFFFRYVPGFTEKNFLYVQARYQENAFLAIFAAAFTPIPYKVFTVASGVFQTGLAVLVSASVLGRGMRFFLVAGLLRWIGEPAKRFIDRYFNLLTIAFLVLLVLGFWAAQYFV